VWDLETSRMKRPRTALGRSATGKEGEKNKKPEDITENFIILMNLNYSIS
jgi:hypothetical protein